METSEIDLMPRHCHMLIKVCGMSDPGNIRTVASLAPMLMGFIFYDKSPRNAIGLDPSSVKGLPPYIRPVAVFVNPSVDYTLDITERYGFKIVQLHGEESTGLCDELRKMGLTVFKAISVSSINDINRAQVYEGHADLFLFDTATPAKGGSGKKFDWDLLKRYNYRTPYLLSGGIGPEDIDSIVAAMRPGMAGIDINSRFESKPGIKDIPLLTKFILSLRKFNENESIATPFWEKTK